MPWIKGVSGNPLGRLVSEKKYTDMLRVVSNEEVSHPQDQTKKVRKLRLMAELVFERALAGESWAVQHIADRLEGKPTQLVAAEGARETVTRKLTYEIVHVNETQEEIDQADLVVDFHEIKNGNGRDHADSEIKTVNGDGHRQGD
jgi:Family of unknown function (DUF5681)